ISTALGESLAGNMPCDHGGALAARSLRKCSQVLVRERVKVEPLPTAPVTRFAPGKPTGEQLTQVSHPTVFPPGLLGQMHLRVIVILPGAFGFVVGPVALLPGLLFPGLGTRLLL